MRTKCTAHFIILDLNDLIILGENSNSGRWHLRRFCFKQIFFIIKCKLKENKLKSKNDSRREARRASTTLLCQLPGTRAFIAAISPCWRLASYQHVSFSKVQLPSARNVMKSANILL
jgi:hypothetical protein